MAIIYCSHTGSNTSPYDTKAKAATTLTAALAVVAADWDEVRVDHTHTGDNALAASTTYTPPAYHCSIVAYDFTNDVSAEMGTGAWIGHSSTARNVSIYPATGKTLKLYGLTFRTASTSQADLSLGAAGLGNDFTIHAEKVYFWNGSTSSSSIFRLGATNSTSPSVRTTLKDCTLRFGHTSQSVTFAARIDIVGGSVSSSGSAPTTLFTRSTTGGAGNLITAAGFDASYVGSGTLVGDSVAGACEAIFTNCKLGASFVAAATQSGEYSFDVYLYDCHDGTNRVHFAHYNSLGSLIVSTSIYANDAPTWDGTNKFSWRIDTTSKATFQTPYVTPWISTYYSNTSSAVTASLEGLISSSSDADAGTQLQDDEVWAEFSYLDGTDTLATIVSDRMVVDGTAANQTSSKGSGDWTGEQTYFSTFKCATTSTISPSTAGEMRARLCVGVNTGTLGSIYLDPQVRTA